MWQRRFKIFLLFLGDIAIFYFSLVLTLVIRYGIISRTPSWVKIALDLHLIPFTILYFVWLIILSAAGLYDINRLRNDSKFYKTLFLSFTVYGGIATAFFYFIPYFGITPRVNLFIDLGLMLVLLTPWRHLFNRWLQKSLRIKAVFLGAGPQTLELKDWLFKNPQLGYQVLGIIAPDNLDELEKLWHEQKFSLIVSAVNLERREKTTKTLLNYLKKSVGVTDLNEFYENITGRVSIATIQEIWFLKNISEAERKIYESIKRVGDIGGSVILGLATLALYPFVALGSKLSKIETVFFKQHRVGKDSKIFTLVKFRSQRINVASEQMRKPLDSEIPLFGKFLRKTHIDELPQSWNIIRGEMSFIGPRPEKPNFVEKLKQEISFYDMRLLVKPGIAGWAQVHNPYASPTIEDTLEKLQYDLYYIKNRSLLLDLSIAFKTLIILFSGAGK